MVNVKIEGVVVCSSSVQGMLPTHSSFSSLFCFFFSLGWGCVNKIEGCWLGLFREMGGCLWNGFECLVGRGA